MDGKVLDLARANCLSQWKEIDWPSIKRERASKKSIEYPFRLAQSPRPGLCAICIDCERYKILIEHVGERGRKREKGALSWSIKWPNAENDRGCQLIWFEWVDIWLVHSSSNWKRAWTLLRLALCQTAKCGVCHARAQMVNGPAKNRLIVGQDLSHYLDTRTKWPDYGQTLTHMTSVVEPCSLQLTIFGFLLSLSTPFPDNWLHRISLLCVSRV